ncbi:MAG: hypothetical protein ABSF25_24285 [Bryobacteraceae bacterium]|jgi:hypothetical protein
MRTPLEDYLSVKLHRDMMERDLEQLHKKLDEFEQRLADVYPATDASPKPHHAATPIPYARNGAGKCVAGASA